MTSLLQLPSSPRRSLLDVVAHTTDCSHVDRVESRSGTSVFLCVVWEARRSCVEWGWRRMCRGRVCFDFPAPIFCEISNRRTFLDFWVCEPVPPRSWFLVFFEKRRSRRLDSRWPLFAYLRTAETQPTGSNVRHTKAVPLSTKPM